METGSHELLSPEVREALQSGRLAHLVTQNADGTPQVSVVWVGIEDDEIVSGHLMEQQKLRNVRRNPQVVLSMQTEGRNDFGLDHHIIVHGTTRVTSARWTARVDRLPGSSTERDGRASSIPLERQRVCSATLLVVSDTGW